MFVQPSGDQLRNIAALVDDGAVRPVVGTPFPFSQTPEALNALISGGLRGKVVVVND